VKYKVVGFDNLGRDYEPQTQVTLALTQEQAKAIAEALNELERKFDGDTYYRVKPIDYRPCFDDMMDLVGDMKTKGQFLHSRGYEALTPTEQDALYAIYVADWGHIPG
jgi:hypothetical protein